MTHKNSVQNLNSFRRVLSIQYFSSYYFVVKQSRSQMVSKVVDDLCVQLASKQFVSNEFLAIFEPLNYHFSPKSEYDS